MKAQIERMQNKNLTLYRHLNLIKIIPHHLLTINQTWFGLVRQPDAAALAPPTLQLTGATIIPSQTVRSLGVYLDSSLTMGPHVGRVAAGCYAKLRVLKEAKPFVPHKIFISLIVQLILSKLDYCNSILVNASCRNLNTLQAVMNTAARLI